MKRIIFRYLHGLFTIYEKNDDADVIVLVLFVTFQVLLLVCILVFLNIPIPSFGLILNEWVEKALFAIIFGLINYYVFGIKEKNYKRYEPYSKMATTIITFTFIGLCLVYLFVIKK